MYRPRARREPTPSRTERYERGGRRTRNARIADRAAKRNVMKDRMLWSPSGAFSVKTPTPTAPAPASKTTIIRIRSLNAPEDEPGRGQDRDAEEDDRGIEDRGTRSHSQIADVVRRDRIRRVHRFGDDHGDRELDRAREEEQARPLSVLEAHRRGSWALRLNHFEGPDTSRRTSFSSTSWIAVRNHATASRYLASRSFVSATNARRSSRRTRSGRNSRWTYRMRKS